MMQASLLSFLDTCLNGVMVKESPPLRTVLSQAPRVLFLYFVLRMVGHLCWLLVQPVKVAIGVTAYISMPWNSPRRTPLLVVYIGMPSALWMQGPQAKDSRLI